MTYSSSYSKAHQRISNRLKNPEVLTNPQKFLGPNYQAVLRWWLYYDSLTDVQLTELNRRWLDIDDSTYYCARNLADNAAIEVIGEDNMEEVRSAAPCPEVITYELIANLDDPFFLPRLVPEFNHKQN